MLQLYQARYAGRYTSESNLTYGLIGDRRIFANMTLNRRAANPREAVPVTAILRKPAAARIWFMSATLLNRTPSGLASFRTKFEILDTPATAISTP